MEKIRNNRVPTKSNVEEKKWRKNSIMLIPNIFVTVFLPISNCGWICGLDFDCFA